MEKNIIIQQALFFSFLKKPDLKNKKEYHELFNNSPNNNNNNNNSANKDETITILGFESILISL